MGDRHTTLVIGDRVALDLPNGDTRAAPRLGTVVSIDRGAFNVHWDGETQAAVDRGWYRPYLRKIPRSVFHD